MNVYRLIRHVYLLMRSGFADRLSDFGLTISEWNALDQLQRASGPLPMTEISRRLLIDPTKTTRVIDALERQKAATRLSDPTDRRSRPVVITSEGRAIFERTNDAMTMAEQEMIARLSTVDRRELERLLSQLVPAAVSEEAEQNGS
jgi:DNA-binding MarR family transcriptional regulator